MGRVRVNDLEKAASVLRALGLAATSSIVETLCRNVRQRRLIAWSEFESFLKTFEGEAQTRDETCYQTFHMMEGILMNALVDANGKSRKELRQRALAAPDIDNHLALLDAGLSSIHAEIQAATRPRQLALLLMFGHVVRYQTMEDFTESWVGHWGRGLDEKRKSAARAVLLGVKLVREADGVLIPDTQYYRNAIAHGGFEFVDDHHLNFWTRDGRDIRHELPPLTDGDLLSLYTMAEKRLRTMEAFSRVIRAWGRHGAI